VKRRPISLSSRRPRETAGLHDGEAPKSKWRGQNPSLQLHEVYKLAMILEVGSSTGEITSANRGRVPIIGGRHRSLRWPSLQVVKTASWTGWDERSSGAAQRTPVLTKPFQSRREARRRPFALAATLGLRGRDGRPPN
jgi:hypothetical protein